MKRAVHEETCGSRAPLIKRTADHAGSRDSRQRKAPPVDRRGKGAWSLGLFAPPIPGVIA